MKKFIFIVPLMAVSLLVSCGGSKDPVMHTLKFEGTHCEMHDESGKTVITKQFEAGQTASFHLVGATEEFDIPKKENVELTYTDTGKAFDGTYSYNVTDGSLSVKMTADITVTATSDAFDPYKVTEQEFKDACSFKDVEYLQATENREEDSETSQVIYEMSPTIFYETVDVSDGIHREECVRKNDDGIYDRFYRDGKDGKYTYFRNVSEEHFITPQDKKINVLEQFTEAGISFNSFTYNENEGIYTATVGQPEPAEFSITLKFQLKKLISYGGTVQGVSHTQTTYSYEEKTPSLPTMDKWYTYDDWWNYCSIDANCRATTDDIGREVELTVNGVPHKVCLIDVDKDVDANGNTIHCTFEFVNVISDENGYSLATFWNDIATEDGSNFNYKESTIRKALNGSGDVNWFRFYGQSFDYEEDPRNLEFAKEEKYKTSVLDMINNENEGFKDALKAPSKYVNIWNDKKQPEAGWEEETINDKLFLLSPAEMGKTSHEDEESKTEVYFHYNGHSEETDSIRIKKQYKGEDGARFPFYVPVTSGLFEGTKYSYAGCGFGPYEGSYYWLRSPYTKYIAGTGYARAWQISYTSEFIFETVYGNALPVAPAFCI